MYSYHTLTLSYMIINTLLSDWFNVNKKTHTIKQFPLPSEKCTHTVSLFLLSLPSPFFTQFPHWTRQPDGLAGMMKWFYKEVGFEVCFEDSKRRRLTDYKWKWVSEDLGLIAEKAMVVCFKSFPMNFEQFFVTRSQWARGLADVIK